MGEELVAYIGTAEHRIEGVKMISFAVLFPSRPSLNYGRMLRNAGDSEAGRVHFAQLCALLKALWQVDRVNEQAGREEIEKVIVKTNARRFVTSVQMELPRICTRGHIGEQRHKARVMEVVKAYLQRIKLDMYFAPTSDAYVEAVGEMAKAVFREG